MLVDKGRFLGEDATSSCIEALVNATLDGKETYLSYADSTWTVLRRLLQVISVFLSRQGLAVRSNGIRA